MPRGEFARSRRFRPRSYFLSGALVHCVKPDCGLVVTTEHSIPPSSAILSISEPNQDHSIKLIILSSTSVSREASTIYAPLPTPHPFHIPTSLPSAQPLWQSQAFPQDAFKTTITNDNQPLPSTFPFPSIAITTHPVPTLNHGRRTRAAFRFHTYCTPIELRN